VSQNKNKKLYTMKKIKALTAVSILFLAVSCSKSGNEVPTPGPSANTKKIKEIIYTDPTMNTESSTFTYDEQGRIKTYTDEPYSYTMTYESPVLMKVTRTKNGVFDQERICNLNDKGAITKMEYHSVPGNAITYTYEWQYDANGYVSKIKGSSPNGNYFEEVFETINGNPVSSKLYHDGVQYHNRSYTYDLSKVNKQPYSAWYLWPSETLFGKPVKNLLIEYKSFDVNNVIDWHTKTTYQLDSDGYPVKYTTDYVHENTKSTTEFKYQ
jgi:hypothetical protein